MRRHHDSRITHRVPGYPGISAENHMLPPERRPEMIRDCLAARRAGVTLHIYKRRGTALAMRLLNMSYLVKEPRNPAVSAVERARRQSERGDERRAMLILREACFAAEFEPALWVHYGLSCFLARRKDEGFRALAHALWLRERARDHARARVMRDLIAHLSGGGSLPLSTRKAA